jgi:hypothetical protein
LEVKKFYGRIALGLAVALASGSQALLPASAQQLTATPDRRPSESANDPMDRHMDVRKVHPRVAQAFGDRFAGQWVDRKVDQPRLVVRLIRPSAGDLELLRGIALSEQVAVVPAHLTEAALSAAVGRVGDVFRNYQRPGLVYPLISQEAVFVAIEDLTSAELGALESAALPAKLVSVSDVNVTDLHTTRFANLPYEGQLQITSRRPLPGNVGAAQAPVAPATQTEQGCSSGFQVRNISVSPPIQYGTTAGHCALTGWSIYIGQQRFGYVNKNPYWSQAIANTDSLSYPLAGSAVPAAPRMFRDISNKHRAVNGSLLKSQMEEGDRLCFGNATHTNDATCSNILLKPGATSQYVDSNNKQVLGLYCLESVQWIGGDSGGPVYAVQGENPAIAAGLIKGTVSARYQNGAAIRLGCFSNIEDVLLALGSGFEVQSF